MAYTKTAWVDGSTPALDAANLNNLEAGVAAALPVFNVVSTYGADPTGVADSTTAIQNAVNAGCAAGGTVFFPVGTYKITAAIVIPFATGWTIQGATRLGTVISQATANTPIFKFTSANTHTWTIRDMRLTYASQQPSSNTSAQAIQFVGNASVEYDYYLGKIESVVFANCCDCIGSVSTTQQSVWGCTFRNLSIESSVTRSVAQLPTSSGQPNNRFDHLYIRADAMVGPCFHMPGSENCQMDNIEINNTTLGAAVLDDQGGGSYIIGSLKVETGTYTAQQIMFAIANSVVVIGRLGLDSLTFNAGATQHYIFYASGGGVGTSVSVRELHFLNCTVTTGQLFISSLDGTTGYCRIEHLVRPLPTNASLTWNTGTVAANATQVRGWMKNDVSANKGDADYTVTIGDPNIISYESNLTAARTVTLPNSFVDNDLFNGLYYRVVRSGAGLFDLKINDASGPTLLDSIVSGKKGAIEYTYRRGAWIQTLKSVF